jgi:hypothetical protein
MADLETILEMRKTLCAMNTSLTPYSGVKEHQRYLDNLYHYKKLLSVYMSRANDELDKSIAKSYTIVRNFLAQSEKNNDKIIDGSK